MLGKYADREFKNVTAEAAADISEDERKRLDGENQAAEDLFKAMKEAVSEVSSIRFTSSLASHAVCLTSEGELSVEMEKVLKKMPGADGEMPKASVALEINVDHPIKEKLFTLYKNDPEMLKKYARILYSEACLISGLSLENPAELCELISELLVK
jgi:molecular chaperone HtpG